MAKKIKQFVVIGLGRFGRSVAAELYRNGYEVLAIDKDEDIIQEVSSYVTHAVQADVTDEDALKVLGVGNFDVAVIAIGSSVQSSIMATLLVKELGVEYVLAKALTDIHGKVLDKIGADRVVYPEREMGIRIANNIMAGNIMDHIELSPRYSIIEIPAFNSWLGRNLAELDLRSIHGINIIAIRRGEEVDISPDPQVILQKGDVLLVIGDIEALRKLNGK